MQHYPRLFHVESNTINSVAKLYQKTEESLSKDVQNLQKWMKVQHHLPEILDDKSLQNFLILNKCKAEKTKEKIDMYYTIRSQLPDLAENMNPKCSNMKEVAKLMYFVPLPKLSKGMYRVFVNKCRNKEKVDQIEPYDVFRMAANLQEIRLKEDVMFGDVLIFDLEGLSLGLLTKMTPAFIAKLITLHKKIYSLAVKGTYVLNSTPYLSTILAIVKTILKPKLFERIYVCKDTSILKEHFSLEMLPKDYGGKEKSLEELNVLCQLKFQEYQDRFDLLDTLRVNESLRPTNLENDEFLGYYGNFQKLDID